MERSVGRGASEREAERKRQTETDRQAGRQTDRGTVTDRQRLTETDRDRDRESHRDNTDSRWFIILLDKTPEQENTITVNGQA